MYSMLYALRISTTPKRNMLCYAIFNQTGGTPRQINHTFTNIFRYDCIDEKCLSLRQNSTLPSLGTEPKVNNLEIVNLRSFLMGLTTNFYLFSKNFFQGHSKDMPCVNINPETLLRLLSGPL